MMISMNKLKANTDNSSMISIKPENLHHSHCPICGHDMENKRIYFTGMRVLISVVCSACEKTFFTDMPTGHGLYYEIFYSLETKELFSKSKKGKWFASALKNCVEQRISRPFTITGSKRREQLLIIPAIDSYYGHSLLRTLTYQYYRDNYPEMDILLIVQDNLKWLLKDSDAMIMSVETRGRHSDRWIENIDEKIWEIAEQYNEVFLSTEYEHIYKSINMEEMTGIPVFDMKNIDERKEIIVGFIWREDRLWIKNDNMHTKLKAADRIMNTSLSDIFLLEQRNKIIELFKNIRKHIKCKCYITGMGNKLRFPDFIEDRRFNTLDDGIERELLRIYSNSDIIIGLHGSSMLLPSAYSAMTIDLMPSYKWSNFNEDLIVRSSNIRDAMFRYRLLSANTPIRDLSECVISMVLDYKHHRMNKIRI